MFIKRVILASGEGVSLSAQLDKPTPKGLFKGDLRFARECYSAGSGSPYYAQDALHLLTAAALSACALPALLVSLIRDCRLEGDSLAFKNSSMLRLRAAGKFALFGTALGTAKLAAACFADGVKCLKAFGRGVYMKVHPECRRQAVLLIDFQGDFFEGGPLAVPGASKAFSVACRLLQAKGKDTCVIASQDWHPGKRDLPEDPEKHGSFASQHNVAPFTMVKLNGADQMAWPEHCVQGTSGAEVKKLPVRLNAVIRKGSDPRIDSYSAFYDNHHARQTKMIAHLQNLRIRDLVLTGLATDYCVRFTAEDALKEGYNVTLITDAIAAIDAENGYAETRKRLEEVSKETKSTIRFMTADEWIAEEAARPKMPSWL